MSYPQLPIIFKDDICDILNVSSEMFDMLAEKSDTSLSEEDFYKKLIDDMIDSTIQPVLLPSETLEKTDSVGNPSKTGKRTIDLHKYTKRGARQTARRMLLLSNRSIPNVFKFNVGRGKHSPDGIQSIPDQIVEVAEELNMPKPQVHSRNQGYLNIYLPTQVNPS
ncbi:hypothetical protein TRFO_42691 [Tritrichomonas foetus]|uniref:Uncharacterized protein n=1 Tax=Tritrichomonas foetus TaxID=1144522 RepID=A0A1J4KZW8_9EUKA|nr:hypothetical protein TRFO_42691 [Tritrichomonas foetus]|eukprot:OHT15141.1 hypothetical protein TRFO_42691 [Tritrichomonas foetus]